MFSLKFKINPGDLDDPVIAERIMMLNSVLPMAEPAWIKHFESVSKRPVSAPSSAASSSSPPAKTVSSRVMDYLKLFRDSEYRDISLQELRVVFSEKYPKYDLETLINVETLNMVITALENGNFGQDIGDHLEIREVQRFSFPYFRVFDGTLCKP